MDLFGVRNSLERECAEADKLFVDLLRERPAGSEAAELSSLSSSGSAIVTRREDEAYGKYLCSMDPRKKWYFGSE